MMLLVCLVLLVIGQYGCLEQSLNNRPIIGTNNSLYTYIYICISIVSLYVLGG